MAKNFKESICELYNLPYGAHIGVFSESIGQRHHMTISREWKARIVFAAKGKLVSLRLNEEYFSNYSLQWVRHLGENRLIGSRATMESFPTEREARAFAMQDIPLSDFEKGYFDAALWSSVEGDGTPLDQNYEIDDIAILTMYDNRCDCIDFIKANRAALVRTMPMYGYRDDAENISAQGHDFWLTRNGHGAGFWDRGFGTIGDKLTDASKAYSDVDLYVGDDGKIHA